MLINSRIKRNILHITQRAYKLYNLIEGDVNYLIDFVHFCSHHLYCEAEAYIVIDKSE